MATETVTPLTVAELNDLFSQLCVTFRFGTSYQAGPYCQVDVEKMKRAFHELIELRALLAQEAQPWRLRRGRH